MQTNDRVFVHSLLFPFLLHAVLCVLEISGSAHDVLVSLDKAVFRC